MGGRIKRDGSYDERNRYYEKRDYSFRSTTFFVSYVTLNATTVTKSATIHYGTSNPTIMALTMARYGGLRVLELSPKQVQEVKLLRTGHLETLVTG